MRTPDELIKEDVAIIEEAMNNTIALMKEHNTNKIMFEEPIIGFVYDEYWGGKDVEIYGVELCNYYGREFLDLLDEEGESASPYSSEQLFYELQLYKMVYEHFNKK